MLQVKHVPDFLTSSHNVAMFRKQKTCVKESTESLCTYVGSEASQRWMQFETLSVTDLGFSPKQNQPETLSARKKHAVQDGIVFIPDFCTTKKVVIGVEQTLESVSFSPWSSLLAQDGLRAKAGVTHMYSLLTLESFHNTSLGISKMLKDYLLI